MNQYTTGVATTRNKIECWLYAAPAGNQGTLRQILDVVEGSESAVYGAIERMRRQELVVVVATQPADKSDPKSRAALIFGPNPKKLGKHKPVPGTEVKGEPNVPLVRRAIAAQHPLFHAWGNSPEHRA